MKYIRIFLFALFFAPMAAFAATPSNEFMVAAQLLSAAKNADIQQVQNLINSGANVNYVDSTGLSLVCTALMNNDVRAAQILQMYGADASQCDRQIKQYESRNVPESSGGLFSGLSSAQSISLAAAGAAVVVGGLFLLTDWLDPGNENNNGGISGGGDRPGQGDGSGGNGNKTEWQVGAIPYGPAMPDAEAETKNYTANLYLYSDAEAFKENFTLMTQTYRQNYLLMMHGYSSFARGYMGQRTLRYEDRSPVPASVLGNYNLGQWQLGGGRPVTVALVTENGINAASKPAGEISAEKNSLDDQLLVWSTMSGDKVNNTDVGMLSSKYYNNVIQLGTGEGDTLTNSYTYEDGTLVNNFDLAGFGTAVNNTSATNDDDLLAKVVGGGTSGYPNADFMGFMPNGQMMIFRTGDGNGLVNIAKDEQSATGTYTMAGDSLATGDTLSLFGKTLTVTRTGNQITAVADDETKYTGYIGADGLLYIDSAADGVIDQAYELADNNLTMVKKAGKIDYYNYKALINAAALYNANGLTGDLEGGRSRPFILANASVIEPLHDKSSATIEDVLSYGNDSDSLLYGFTTLINEYYNNSEKDGVNGNDDTPDVYATAFFKGLGMTYSPLVIFSTGASETDANYSGKHLEASFENSAPLVFDNMEHLFMSVVPVSLSGAGTANVETVSGFNPSNSKYQVSQWQSTNGTSDTTDDDTFYMGRVCGVAGTGANGVDPWCFAAAGVTDELAVASAAGAAGSLKSAFSYMSSEQLFTLMALTADGAYLGTDTSGNPFSTEESLISYLQGIYQMPNEYEYRWKEGGENYLDVFKEVFGYGVINLERATKPGTNIYFYNGTDIVSDNGNAYWRAATNTVFRPSSVFGARAATISAPFFDVLESFDGSMTLPRVWKNEFSLAGASERGLYMGDVLGDFKTRDSDAPRVQFGNFGFSMAFSEKPYVDNLNGLDELSVDYSLGNWNFAAGYQRHFTDGNSRYNGMSNPILGLASNVVASDVAYGMGRWSFGARAYSGNITDETMLDNDPTISSQYLPARLGMMHGVQSDVAWNGDKFGFTAAFGVAHETNTLLGALSGGLLNMGNGDTSYIDTELRWAPMDKLNFTLRSTFARTSSDASGEFILGMSDVDSRAFAFGMDIGNFKFSVSQPLVVTNGYLMYPYADYDITESADGKYDLAITNTHVEHMDLSAQHREVRFVGEYRHNFGEFTDGAVGFIYRVNPNNTDMFGNEAILMMKMTHRLGI